MTKNGMPFTNEASSCSLEMSERCEPRHGTIVIVKAVGVSIGRLTKMSSNPCEKFLLYVADDETLGQHGVKDHL
jgi:dihydrodipicolinate synthase/N-acetylneuraminate lyase